MKTYRSRAQDQGIAASMDHEATLMCSADGCPNRWTVSAGDRGACSAHAWAPAHHWPAITGQQLHAMSERARFSDPPVVARMTPDQKAQTLRRLRDVIRAIQHRSKKLWAEELREREETGESLTLFQRDAWRKALKSAEGDE